jgi:filamentous hemagglutinin family protein
LFHSFQQFSVPTGGTVIFNNAADIQNIVSRVTGGSVSNIDGTIRASGTAIIFLINPNGIITGSNASLNVGGSFVAANASAIRFGNQGSFSALNPNTPELLKINPSALLFTSTTNETLKILVQSPALADLGVDVINQVASEGDETFFLPPGRDLKIERIQQQPSVIKHKQFRLDLDASIRLNLVDTPKISIGCTASGTRTQSKFIITGRGGLPPNPRNTFSSNKPTPRTFKPVVEATGWVKNAFGEVLLTANSYTTAPNGLKQNPLLFHALSTY